MKALIYDNPWEMRLADLPVSEPAEGEVLLRSIAVGICGSDVHGFTGESGRRKSGMVMGHEAVGEVVSIGKGVHHLKVGDQVAVFNINGCGKCRFCESAREQLCPDKRILGVNAGQWGAMAEYFSFPESGLFKIDPSTDANIGVLVEPIAVGIHAMQLMKPSKDSTVVIVGAGTIGLGLTIALKASGVKQIFALDKVPAKLALIEKFGATPVNVDKEDPLAVIRAATHNQGADGVFEAVGAAPTVRSAYDLCAVGGTLVLIGNLAKEFSLPLQGVTSNEVTIKGSYGFTKQDFKEAVELVGNKDIPLDLLISGTCTLEETPGVMTRIAKGEMNPIKIIIRP